MPKELKLADMSIETLTIACQDAFEDVSTVFDTIESNWKRLEHFGKLLAAARAKVPHGEWGQWIETTFEGRLHLRTVRRWIAEAKDPEAGEKRREANRDSKRPRMAELESGDFVSVLSEEKEKPLSQPTNRKNTAATRKVREEEKTLTAIITPTTSIVHAESVVTVWLGEVTLSEVFSAWVRAKYEQRDIKTTAQQLREIADNIDPPAEPKESKAGTKVPSVDQLLKAIPDDVPQLLREPLNRWASHKQSLQAKSRIRNMIVWQTMLEKMALAVETFGVKSVSSSILNSIANNYVGWDWELKNNGGNAGGNHTTINGNGRPAVQKAKIKYQ